MTIHDKNDRIIILERPTKMPNIAKMLKDEMQRISRKEVKAATASLRQDVVTLKRTAADHKRRIAQLERLNRQLIARSDKRGGSLTRVSVEEVEKARISGKMIRSIRKRLGLSQADFAKLVSVSAQSVFQWEHKAGRLDFRGQTKTAILSLRKLKKKEALAQLEKMAER
jgi:DNA-binding transcriptional regulator YiaG